MRGGAFLLAELDGKCSCMILLTKFSTAKLFYYFLDSLINCNAKNMEQINSRFLPAEQNPEVFDSAFVIVLALH